MTISRWPLVAALASLALPFAAQAQTQAQTQISVQSLAKLQQLGLGSLGSDYNSYVYVASNAKKNKIAVLSRNFFGGLDKVQEIATGGFGSGTGTAVPNDPLGSQNSLLLSQDGRFLFAVDAGSDQISVFAVRGKGKLDLVDIEPSGGKYPVSLAQRDNTLYVLNNGGQANVVGFQIELNGQLQQIKGSKRQLGVSPPLVGAQPDVARAPAQLQFTPNGDFLAVTIKNQDSHGSIQLYAVDAKDQLAQQPVTTAVTDTQPFGFTFDKHGNLLTSEAGSGAAASYAVGTDGKLSAITSAVPNGQGGVCWLDASRHFAYTANAGSNTISAFTVDAQGHLALLGGKQVAASLGTGHGPTDLKISSDGNFINVVNSVAGSVSTLLINDDGSLQVLGETPVFPAGQGMQGIAVN